MKLYYAPNTRAVRIVWLLEELGLSYDLERFALGDRAMRAPAYLKINPMGRVPTLQDDDVTISDPAPSCSTSWRATAKAASCRKHRRQIFPPICNGCTTPRA